MQRIRWGLCCLFKEAPIKFRTTTVTFALKLKERDQTALIYLSQIINDNLDALAAAILYCAKHGIGSFRINSQLLPIFTHAIAGYQIEMLPQSELIFEKFEKCKKLAIKHHMRLTFHPDQFVILNSPLAHVVENSLKELEYHGLIAELLGADVINIHGGGMYGDKKSALKRFEENFYKLSDRVKERLTVENDDKCFTPLDLLPLCQKIKIPLVYDVHHHRCLMDSFSIAEASQSAFETWKREPLFHISSPLEGWSGPRPQRHHDYIDIIDFPACWLNCQDFTLEVEAKAKEVAVAKLYQEVQLLQAQREIV